MTRRFAASLALVCALATAGIVLADPAEPIWRASSPWSTERATVTIGDQVIAAEVADTSSLQVRGLSFRDGLEPGTGMLFVFDEAQSRSFWMRGMRFCLDIIWIEDGKIVGAAENACPMPEVPESELPRYESNEPVTYVLEMPAGWLDELGFGPGQPVTIELPDSAS